MSKITNIAAAIAVLPVLALSSPVHADTATGQIEQGDIYRSENITSGAAFADSVSGVCGDTVAYRVRIHNGGPATITNVKVAATLDQTTASTTHGSVVSLTADNNFEGTTVTANAGVTSSSATTATYVSGSTELLDYSATPGDESVIQKLPDGILSGGVNVGSIGPLTSDTEEVQFEAKLSCATPTKPTPTPTKPTPATTTTTTTPTPTPTQTTTSVPTTLVNTGPGSVLAIFAAVSAASAVAYRFVIGRRLARR
jgi:hypothetical protein